jgi:trimethylamine--corrinoid protein Co-methyltransferase
LAEHGIARGRRRAAAARRGALPAQPPFRQPELRYAPVEPVRPEAVEAIHDASMEILETIGMRVLEPEARSLFRAAGAMVDEGAQTVRLDRGLVMALVGQAPPAFDLHARNPAKTLGIGGRRIAFTAVGGPAFVQDAARGRRRGTFADAVDYLKLIQTLDVIHQEGGTPFEALDLPPETRHLDMHRAQIGLLDKNWQPWGLGRERARDGLEMAALAFGTTREGLAGRCVFACIINTNSPLTLDIPMAEGLIEMARHGQAVVATPFTLAGAMAPVTLAGALAQQNAEALAAIALTQIVRPGAPAVYGTFTTNVDMKTGAPGFGTPEFALAAQISGQLARRYRLPWRSSNATAANEVDAQAAWESMMSLWGAILGGANLIVHGAGWLGGGLTASFEKLIVDAEMLGMMAAYLEPPEVSPDTLALDAIREVGFGGHFFGAAHTRSRYENAFHRPMIADWDNFDSWTERGSPTARDHAARLWPRLLDAWEPPPLDVGIAEALDAYVARRKREIAAGVGVPRA